MTSKVKSREEQRVSAGKSIFSLKIRLSYPGKMSAWRRDLREWKISVTEQRLSFLTARKLLRSTWKESSKHQTI
jgi:hypothetical protein